MSEIFQVEIFGSLTSAEGIPIFFPGQDVHARVVLHLLEPMKARAIDLHISGKAKVHWTESESSGSGNDRRSSTENYDSEAIYLNQTMQLLAPPDQQIHPIEHIFPFQFTIPPHCPPSFEGTIGRIRYTCSVTIDRPWRFDKKIESIFLVSSVLDLNTIEWALGPADHYIDKNIGCCCWRHGKIKAKIQLPKSGFVPDEVIPFTIQIDNQTSKQVTKVKTKLYQNVLYLAQRFGILRYDFSMDTEAYWDIDSTKHAEKREENIEIAEIEEQFMLAPRSKGTFRGHLAVPDCISSFNNCPVIRLDYFLEIKVVTTSFWCGSASNQVPLLIGTIPIHEYPNSSIHPQFPVDNAVIPLAPPAYSEHSMTLTSYE